MPERERGRSTTTRRSLLAGLGTAGAVGTGGCLTTLPSFGQRVRFGDVDAPAPSSPTYRDWIPEEITAYDTPGSQSVEYVVPGERGENTLGGPYRDRSIKDVVDHVGVAVDTFDHLVRVGRTAVGRAEFDRDDVEEVLSGTRYEPHGSYHGFDLYRRTPPGAGRGRTVAVGDERLLFARAGPEAVEEVVDTGAGRRARRHESDPTFALLTDELGAQPVTTLGAGGVSIDGVSAEASGGATAFDDDAAYVIRVYVFPEDEAVSRAAVEGWISEDPGSLEPARVDVRVDDRVVDVTFRFDHGTFAERFGPLFEYPHVTWAIDYDDAGETLSFVHEAGETVDASVLSVVDRTGETTVLRRLDEEYGTIGPGERITVDLSESGEWSFAIQGRVPGTDDRWTEVGYNHTRA